ncbi:MAG: UDP-N-acetyl-d-glucosamine 6-dehydrogenase WbpA [Methyloceanibacter sp.]|nr:MAG: UDP-N-acetyl-d-glucosamine 6-dehydrogenase WbpA [Methyloceanibacter sp.]
MTLPALADIKIGIIGLGYVGLPLAVYLSRIYPVVGFDIDAVRIDELSRNFDRTLEVTDEEFAAAEDIRYTADITDLGDCNFYIVTVPTPVDQAKRPDLSALVASSRAVGSVLKPGDIVVYESTVFPGATEEVCVPELENASGLTYNEDFYAGYSPERINPGDHTHRLPDILKITSGSTPEVAELVDAVYASTISAGTHRASSIRVAEAAKVIENIQRDVNIALINELAMLFKELNLETLEVLEAAGTKWNFLPFRPGLVGGHCIGVDPYYLTYKAESIGFHPQMILAGRRINDGMATFVANDVIKSMLKRKLPIDGARILVMGFTFKENVPDTRNTKVIDLVGTLRDFVSEVVIYDPMADNELAKHEYGVDLTNELPAGPFEAIILAVKHEPIATMGETGVKALLAPGGLIYDLKDILPRNVSNVRI